MTSRPLKVVFVSAEAIPFAKTGGLADVCGVLPAEIARLGHDVSLILPAYRCVHRAEQPIEPTDIEFEVPIGTRRVQGRLLRSRLPQSSVPVYLVDQPEYFDRPALYGERGKDYLDNCERFVFLSRGAMEALKQLGTPPDILHAHDWQTGLVPAYLKTLYALDSFYAGTSSLFSLHNLAYQGRFWHWDMLLTGIDWKHFNWREMEYHGDLSLLKTGIVFADWLTTVSPTYATEIQTAPLGCGLEGVLAERREQLTGIINGIDATAWDPATDPHLSAHFTADDLSGKATCKAALQEAFGVPVDARRPLIGIVGRLAQQKGWELVLPLMRDHIDQHLSWVILGSGDPGIENELLELHASHPDVVGVRIGFDESLAHRIEAGADMFLMASRYEPCGLNQLYSQRYGTIPIVHATGGLKDTVVDAVDETIAAGTATGFHFAPFTLEAAADALHRALALWRDNRETWTQLMRTAMAGDWSWGPSATRYVQLYERLVAERHGELVPSRRHAP